MKKLLLLTLSLLVGLGIAFAFTYEWVIDEMEYPDNATAQLAYVSSDDYGSDVLTGGTAIADSIHSAPYSADKGCDDDEGTYWLSGAAALPHWWKYDLGGGVTKTITKLRVKPSEPGFQRFKDFTLQGSNNDSDWDTLHTGQHANNSDWEEYTFTNTTAYRYYKINVISTWEAGTYAAIYEIEMIEGGNLRCFSEITVVQQGTYSLKGVATDDALNDTLTRTLTGADKLDLTNSQGIEYDIYALRTGSNIKLSIHDSGGTTTEHTANVASSNENQTESWDMSEVADADKDDIDEIKITITNADSQNTFFLDDIKWGITAVSGGSWTFVN